MRALILSATAAALAMVMPATAQTRPASPKMETVNFTMPRSWRGVPDPSVECLVNKRTRALECRSRAEWRKVAARIEEQRAKR